MEKYTVKQHIEMGCLFYYKQISVDFFMDFFSLSPYEFNNDILSLNDMGLNYGVKINRKKDILELEIVNEKKYDNICRPLRSFWFTNRYVAIDEDRYLQNEICKLLIWNNKKYISIDEIAERTGYSRSSLRVALKTTRELFNYYYIELATIPHHGLLIKGNELSIRNCLLTVYSLYDIRVINGFDDELISHYLEDYNYTVVFSKVRNVFEKYGLRIPSIERKRLILNLIIQNVRTKKGCYIKNSDFKEIDDRLLSTLETLDNGILYNIAADLINSLHSFVSKEEIQAMTIYAASSLVEDERICKIINDIYSQEVNDVTDIICEYLLNEYTLDIRQSSFFDNMKKCVTQLVMRNHTNILLGRGQNINGRIVQPYSYPLLFRMMRDVTQLLSDYYKKDISCSQFAKLMTVIFYYIQSLSYKVKLPKVAIVSRNSIMEPYMVKASLASYFDNEYLKDIQIIDYDDIYIATCGNKLCDDYDLILCDQKMVDNEKLVSYADDEASVSYIAKLIKSYTKLDFAHLKQGNIESTDADLNSTKWIENTINTVIEKTNSAKDQVIKQFDSKNYFEDIVVIIVDSNKDDYLQIGNVTSEYRVKKKSMRKYIILCVKWEEDKLRFYSQLLKEMVTDRLFFNSLINNPSLEEIENQVNSIMGY